MGQFHIDLTAIVEKTKLRIDDVVQKATFDIFRSVILKSPVDTGRFKANWQSSVGSYASISIDATDPSGTSTINAMASVALSTKAGNIVYLTNNLPYATFLEYGGSIQAPSGMVRTTITEYQQYINSAISGLR